MKALLATITCLAALPQLGLSFQPTHSPRASLGQKTLLAPGGGSSSLRLLAETAKRGGVGRPGALRTATESTETGVSAKREVDFDAIAKYGVALFTQMGLFTGLFFGLDKLVATAGIKVPFAVNCIFFYFTTLKSRVLNPMPNNRPQPKTLEVKESPEAQKRVTPTWTPPGFVFPIMWLLIIAPLRATAASMVYKTTGTYANVAILSLILHLSIGDIWNTINNVERRYGVAVIGVLFVWLSKVHAAYRFFQVDQLAGKLLGLTVVWLTIATALITRTWQLNPDPETGKPETLYPAKGKGETRFSWFSKE